MYPEQKDDRATAGGQRWAALEEAKKAEGRKMTRSLTWVTRFQSGTDSRRSSVLRRERLSRQPVSP